MATHSSVLAWRIPGTEEPGGLPSMGSHRVRQAWNNLAAAAAAAAAAATYWLEVKGCCANPKMHIVNMQSLSWYGEYTMVYSKVMKLPYSRRTTGDNQ